jgi:hypothetical protein
MAPAAAVNWLYRTELHDALSGRQGGVALQWDRERSTEPMPTDC